MKEFCIKATVFIVLGLVILSLMNYRYINTNGYKSLNDTNKFINMETRIEIGNLGSSHGLHSFYYNKSSVKGFNFALNSQGFYYDYRILQQYSDNIKKHALILIPISYFSFYQNDSEDDFKRSNPRYYRFMHSQYIKDFSYADLIRYKIFPILSAGTNKKYMIIDKKTVQNDWEVITTNQYKTLAELEKYGYMRAQYHIKGIQKNKKDNYLTIKELENIIVFCKQKQFTPILITTPFTEYYNKHFSKDFYNEFYNQLKSIRKKYNLTYLDYSHDQRFTNNIELFLDTDHLNLNGRKKFTSIILQDLKVLYSRKSLTKNE